MRKRLSVRAFSGVVVVLTALLVGLNAAGAQTAEELLNPEPDDWPTYGRDLTMSRFSPLDQINRDNVEDLRLSWSRSMGFNTDAQFSPTVYNGVMYVNGPDRVVALDATNGEMIWEYLAELDERAGNLATSRNRGSVVVFDDKVYHALADGRVVGLDVETGEEAWSTPVTNIELSEGFSTGPMFADGKIIVGPSGADIGGVPGRILALDSENGEILWTFNTVPRPGDAGFETWDPPSSAEWGGGSAWNTGAFDPETGTLIYGVGQPIPWPNFEIRGDPSPDLYTASWVALDIDTGELKWYHQVVPGDEWDYDQIATPTVADLEIDGEARRTAILPTTTGYLVLVDVETGEFIRAHELHPDPNVHLGYDEDGAAIINEEMRTSEPGQLFTICPLRWVDFEPAAYHPETDVYFRPNTHECYEITNDEIPEDWQPGEGPVNSTLTPLPDSYDRLGGLSAIDPASGEVLWEWTSGYSQRSGPVATAGGLVFMGSPDRGFRAFDAETGDVLWEQRLTAYIQANPITYAVDGTQYVAIPVGGSGPLVIAHQSDEEPIVSSDVAMFVFALPEKPAN
jgi:alcohol dehydrogenase (cytochrome c)